MRLSRTWGEIDGPRGAPSASKQRKVAGFVRLLIVLAAIAALVQIVRFAISDQVAIDEPELALTLDGRNWKALMVQADKALREERSDDAARDVRSALRADPLAGGSASGARHH